MVTVQFQPKPLNPLAQERNHFSTASVMQTSTLSEHAVIQSTLIKKCASRLARIALDR